MVAVRVAVLLEQPVRQLALAAPPVEQALFVGLAGDGHELGPVAGGHDGRLGDARQRAQARQRVGQLGIGKRRALADVEGRLVVAEADREQHGEQIVPTELRYSGPVLML